MKKIQGPKIKLSSSRLAIKDQATKVQGHPVTQVGEGLDLSAETRLFSNPGTRALRVLAMKVGKSPPFGLV